jgi:phosphate starvation-inducible PhoH-like protein
MLMFLTRLGPGSTAVITGDVTQIDLQKKQESGLVRIQQILSAVPEIQFCYFEEKDVVRHRLVKSILKAFATHEADEAQAEASGQ